MIVWSGQDGCVGLGFVESGGSSASRDRLSSSSRSVSVMSLLPVSSLVGLVVEAGRVHEVVEEYTGNSIPIGNNICNGHFLYQEHCRVKETFRLVCIHKMHAFCIL